MRPPSESYAKARQNVIAQLKAVLAAAQNVDDATVIYLVGRALRACTVRWNDKGELR